MLQANDMPLDSLRLLNAAPDNYLFLLPDAPHFTIVGVTDAYLKATFTQRKALLGKGIFEAFPDNPDLPDATGVKNLRASLLTVMATRQKHCMPDQRYDVPDPQTGGFAFKVWRPCNFPVWNEAGEVQYIIHHVEDITEAVHLGEKAKVAQEVNDYQAKLLYNLFMQAPVAIAIFRGPAHVIEMANEAHLKIWRRTAEQVIGKPVFEALPEARGQGFEALLSGVLTTGKPDYAYERSVSVVRTGREERLYFNFVYHPLKDLDGSISGVIVIANEITEQVVARRKREENEARLQAMNRELQRINANLEEFAYAASHDLKEPVRKIRFFTDQLKHELKSQASESQNRLLARLENAGRRMGTLIEDLLTYAQVTEGIRFQEPVDLNDTMEKVQEDLELAIEEKQAKIAVHPLPRIVGHPRQLQQLFQNLIGNALKYSKAGVPPSIQVTCRQVGGRDAGLHAVKPEADPRFYLIEVKDNGIGFEQKDAKLIFNLFTRLDHTMEEQKGSGVGLSIARKAAENHGGSITAESEPGKGSVFQVLLPAREGA